MIGNDWDIILKEEYNKDYFKKLMDFVNKEYQSNIIFPQYNNIFKSLKYTAYKDIKVVILGQDPYHGENQANGLAFSVNENVKYPPSLKNIYKELENDLGIKNNSGDLTSWAKEGVLLLNSVLTVRKDTPASHKNEGWEIFTYTIIKKINDKKDSVVFILWGNYARDKKKIITNNKHLIIESAHPSPLSAYHGFFESKPFSKTNKYLKDNNQGEIQWKI